MTRPSFVVYGLLAAFILGSAFPFYWSFLVALEKLQSGYYVDYSLVLAGTTLATVPVLIVFIVLGRQIVAGIMQGAVKG